MKRYLVTFYDDDLMRYTRVYANDNCEAIHSAFEVIRKRPDFIKCSDRISDCNIRVKLICSKPF